MIQIILTLVSAMLSFALFGLASVYMTKRHSVLKGLHILFLGAVVAHSLGVFYFESNSIEALRNMAIVSLSLSTFAILLELTFKKN